MATGDQNDVLGRLKATLPPWFGDLSEAPIISALLTGLAEAGAFVFSLYAYAALQTRIRTATDGWLDMIAADWFGGGLLRRQGQTDASYRAIIIASIMRERATRNAVTKVLTDITGRAPRLVEPRRPVDTGGYGAAGYGYGVSGAYGSQLLPRNMAFVIAYRPLVGSLQYGVQDADIYAAVDSVRPTGSTLYVQLNN